MEFDSADIPGLISSGRLDETILHEMGHVLGFGSLWDVNRSLLVGGGSGSTCGASPTFVGTNAVREWRTLSGQAAATGVPVEGSTSVPGSCDSHWRESTFLNELMTPQINSGANPLSRLSIAAMQDLGYTVNYGAADSYALPSPAARALAQPLDPNLRMRPIDASRFEMYPDRPAPAAARNAREVR